MRALADPTEAADLPVIAADALERIRKTRPRVHCITNAVAQAFTANVMLAVGADPSMTIAVDEIADFVGGAHALLVNLGTMNPERHEAVGIAVEEAREGGVPWVLDPVFVDRSAVRLAFARSLIDSGPRVVRLNASEFAAFAGTPPDETACARFAGAQKVAVALTGNTDVVADARRRAAIANGDPMMTRVTAMGCAGSALVTTCLAVESDPWRAAAAGLLLIGIAGEVAAARAAGPGSLGFGILDALYNLDRATILQRARVS
jgi:hydroxyethylthiazole kinase